MAHCPVCDNQLSIEHPKYWLHSCHEIAKDLYMLVYDAVPEMDELYEFMISLKDHIMWRKKAPRLSS